MDRLARSGWILPAISGLMLVPAYYSPLLPFNFIAHVPLLYWLDANRNAGRYPRFKAGFVAGFAAYFVGLHFLLALTQFSWLAVLLWIGFAVAMGVRVSLTVALLGWLRRGSRLTWGLLLPVGWLPFEWVQAFGDLRMTGDHTALSLARYPFLVQFSDLLGPYGVGLFMLAVNGLVYETLFGGDKPARRRAGASLLLVCALVLGYDAWAWTRPEPPGRSLRVAIVQPNIPPLIKWDQEKVNEQWQNLVALSTRAAAERPDLIVWPETARPLSLHHWLDRPRTYTMPDVGALAVELGVPFLVGVEYFRIRTAEDYDMYNAAMAVDAQGRLSPSWGAKVYLVPFTEALPFRRVLGPLLEGRGGEWHWVTGGFEPGPGAALVDTAGARIGVLICFEQLFAELASGLRNAGAELQVVLTNDTWFGRTVFQLYQANALRLRAIESRTAFVRAANTGISGFVDRRGRFFDATPLYENAVRVRDVRLSTGRTIYNRTGDAIVWVILLTLAWAVFLARKARKNI
jgi:apolipoprotein N-acyltransferase